MPQPVKHRADRSFRSLVLREGRLDACAPRVVVLVLAGLTLAGCKPDDSPFKAENEAL